MTDDRSEATFNDIVPEDRDKNPSASNSLNQEGVEEDQEISSSASTETDQISQDEEHTIADWPAQDMNYGQRSDQWEEPNPEESNPQEAAENANIRN